MFSLNSVASPSYPVVVITTVDINTGRVAYIYQEAVGIGTRLSSYDNDGIVMPHT